MVYLVYKKGDEEMKKLKYFLAHIKLLSKDKQYKKDSVTKRMIENRIISELQARKFCHERSLPYDETLLSQDILLFQQVNDKMKSKQDEVVKEWSK